MANKKFGLTLGGGGARGAAHIGVLAELERLDLRPDLITGTSMGGMLGALAAAGLRSDAIAAFFEKLTIAQMYGLPGSLPAFSSSNKVEKLLEATIGRLSFSDLKTPLALVATDLISRKSIVMDEGDLITAVLATSALPLLLPPVERGEFLLVDGGILNNVPFDIAQARGATFTLAVDLTNSAPFGTPADPVPSTTGIVGRVLTATQRRRTWQIVSTVTDIITAQSLNARLAISPPELLIRPEVGTIGLLDFHRWQECVELGKTAVLAHEAELVANLTSRE